MSGELNKLFVSSIPVNKKCAADDREYGRLVTQINDPAHTVMKSTDPRDIASGNLQGSGLQSKLL